VPIDLGSGGGGAGGRIAVWAERVQTNGQVTVTGGLSGYANPGSTGEVGTVVWRFIPQRGSIFILK
jgi:hypothetical protein